jgi:hypothetical protein
MFGIYSMVIERWSEGVKGVKEVEGTEGLKAEDGEKSQIVEVM